MDISNDIPAKSREVSEPTAGSEPANSRSLTKMASALFETIRTTKAERALDQKQFFVQSVSSTESEEGIDFECSLQEYSYLLNKVAFLHKDHPELPLILERLQRDLINAAQISKQFTEVKNHQDSNGNYVGLSMQMLPMIIFKLAESGITAEELYEAMNYQGRDTPEINALSNHIRDIQQEILATMSEDGLPSLADYRKIQSQLNNQAAMLSPGEHMVIPGLSCNHAGLIKIERQPNGLYKVSIFNSGYGLKHHQPLGSNHTKRATCLPKEDIPFDGSEGKPGLKDILSVVGESLCLDRFTEKGNRQSIDLVYRTFLDAPGTRLRTTNKDLYRKGQSGGSCSKECIDCFVSYELANLTLKDSHKSAGLQLYKDIQLILKVGALAALTKDHLASMHGIDQAQQNTEFLANYATRVTKYLQQRQTINDQEAPPDHALIISLAEHALKNIVKQLSPDNSL